VGVLARFDHLAAMGPAAYGLLALLLFAEAVGVPSPDEATLFLAGVAVGRGDLSWPLVVGASAAGAVAGALVSYGLARRLGRPLIVHHGRRVGLTEARLARVEGFVRRRGALATYLGRIVSGVRLVIGYASGLFGVEPGPFAIASVAGALTWSALDVTAGMLFGGHIAALEHFALGHLVLAALIAAVVTGAALAWHLRGPRPARDGR
jgi:membrane protein DedA with SNARE-associated domain